MTTKPTIVAASFLALLPTAAPVPAAAQANEEPCPHPEARAFDFWIGSWDVVNRNRRPDDTRFHVTGRATYRVYPVAGGCAIVEHWRGRAIGRFIVGFSVRAYDPEAGPGPRAGSWSSPVVTVQPGPGS